MSSRRVESSPQSCGAVTDAPDAPGSTMCECAAATSRCVTYSDAPTGHETDTAQVYNDLKSHIDIRMPVKKIEKGVDKVMILIQVCSRIRDSIPHINRSGLVLGGVGRHIPSVKAVQDWRVSAAPRGPGRLQACSPGRARYCGRNLTPSLPSHCLVGSSCC